MAFDFLGTFNTSQFNRFMAFARSQTADIARRLAHLNYEKKRMGSLTFEYDEGGVPTSYVVSGVSSSYIGRLVAAYEALGGQVEFDLQVRTRDQAVYLMEGDEVTPPQFMSNGDVVGTRGLDDKDSAELIRRSRTWMQPALHYRREYLERKVRRAIDYVDQLDDEIQTLSIIVQPDTTEYSLAYIAKEVGKLLTDTEYRSIFDDRGQDPHGKTVYAPLLAYSRANGATTQPSDPTFAGRDDDGYVYPGDEGDV